jgi:hypothetical protein
MCNTVKNSLGSEDFIDQIILSLNHDDGRSLVYILVEGVYDRRLYPKFFDEGKASVECVGTKEHVCEVLARLNNKTTKKAIGICDADFNHLQNMSPHIQNLYFTDFHDIEMTMLSIDGVLNDALTEYGLQNNVSTILQKALGETQIIGYIRLLNQIDVIKLDFGRMGLGKFITPHNIDAHLDIDAYLCALNKRSNNKTRALTSADITLFIQKCKGMDLFNLCNGHDVTTLIALIIGKSTSPENFCAVLRASFNIHYFSRTKLYADILKWQIKHGFTILRS